LADESVLRIADAIDRLDWQPMLRPTMPHAYTVSTWRSLDRTSFDAVLAMIDHSPDTVLAYWRGYQRPTRYWHGPNGFRYWFTPGYEPGSIVLNRTDDVDDTRPVALGGEPIRDWVGCPWEPQGDGPRNTSTSRRWTAGGRPRPRLLRATRRARPASAGRWSLGRRRNATR
jgi:hypothetical protein